MLVLVAGYMAYNLEISSWLESKRSGTKPNDETTTQESEPRTGGVGLELSLFPQTDVPSSLSLLLGSNTWTPEPGSGRNQEKAWHQGPEDETEEKTLTVSAGDTLIDLLLEAGLENIEAHKLIQNLEERYNPRKLGQGQEIAVAFARTEQGRKFQALKIKLDPARDVRIIRGSNGDFTCREIAQELKARPALAEARIESNLYQAALEAGLPIQVLMEIIKAYSYDVDFQRDIRSGDTIEVMYEEKVDESGQVLKTGSAQYACLQTRDKKLPIYRYQTSDGEDDFFNPQGKSVRKTLMVTPVDGARISSGYGMRRHPIQGYNKMHKGLDFAAPSGTPIMAAGDGIVERAGRNGGYGHYIKIRHPNEYHTVYGHLSRYGRGIQRGARVKQGQIIGYVGSTGNSTGPHLHYEVHHRGGHVNPAAVDTPPGRTLDGKELQRFKTAKKEIEKSCQALVEDTYLALGENEASEETTVQ
ncbi:MAG: peptidoglycan DD-metalloendopeptidase family protein [Desulfovermiculus sp.]